MQPLFLVTFFSHQEDSPMVTTIRQMATLDARSKAEAIGLGVLQARVELPEDEGWAGHQAIALQVPEYMLREALGLEAQ